MKTRLVAMLERLIVDAREAIAAVERDDVDEALEKFAAIGARVEETARQLLESNEPGGSHQEATPGSSTNGG